MLLLLNSRQIQITDKFLRCLVLGGFTVFSFNQEITAVKHFLLDTDLFTNIYFKNRIRNDRLKIYTLKYRQMKNLLPAEFHSKKKKKFSENSELKFLNNMMIKRYSFVSLKGSMRCLIIRFETKTKKSLSAWPICRGRF